mgnify:CR=1 FL=1
MTELFIKLKELASNTVGEDNEIFSLQLQSLLNLYNQSANEVDKLEEQIISLFAAKNGFLKKVNVKHVHQYEKELLKEVNINHPELLEMIESKKVMDEELTQAIKDVLTPFTENFVSSVEA